MTKAAVKITSFMCGNRKIISKPGTSSPQRLACEKFCQLTGCLYGSIRQEEKNVGSVQERLKAESVVPTSVS